MAKKKATKKAVTKKATKKAAAKKTTAKTTKKTAEKKTADEEPVKKKRKSRKKKAEEIRRKLYWGVFNHAMKRVALYEFNQRKAAEKRAKELSPEGKPPHFVQKVKEDVVAEPKPGEEAATATKVKKAKKKKGAKH
jgi:hypothetical protein